MRLAAPGGHLLDSSPARVPHFNEIYAGAREQALAHYGLLVRCGSTPESALRETRERVVGVLRVFKGMRIRSAFQGRRIGARKKLLRAIEMGQGKLAEKGRG